MKMEKLTESEEVVMRAIWDCKNERILLQDVVDRVNGIYGREWAPQTVSTFLAHLRKKDYIVMYRRGRICRYEVKISEQDYRRRILKEVCIFLYKDDKEQMINDLAVI